MTLTLLSGSVDMGTPRVNRLTPIVTRAAPASYDELRAALDRERERSRQLELRANAYEAALRKSFELSFTRQTPPKTPDAAG